VPSARRLHAAVIKRPRGFCGHPARPRRFAVGLLHWGEEPRACYLVSCRRCS